MKVEASPIRPHEHIRAIHKERHARRHNGGYVQWFVTDKYGRLLLSSGKLSALQAYINANAAQRHDRVHLGGLYQSMDRNDSRTGGYYLMVGVGAATSTRLSCCGSGGAGSNRITCCRGPPTELALARFGTRAGGILCSSVTENVEC